VAKYLVTGTATWPAGHPSSPSKTWAGVYEATSADQAKNLGVAATLAAWKDLGVLDVQATGAELVSH
jgi:hypothetical protein